MASRTWSRPSSSPDGAGRGGRVEDALAQQGRRTVPDLLDGVGHHVDGHGVAPRHRAQQRRARAGLAEPAEGLGRVEADGKAAVVERGTRSRTAKAEPASPRSWQAADLDSARWLLHWRRAAAAARGSEQAGQGLPVLALQVGEEGAGLGLEDGPVGGDQAPDELVGAARLLERPEQHGAHGCLALRVLFPTVTPGDEDESGGERGERDDEQHATTPRKLTSHGPTLMGQVRSGQDRTDAAEHLAGAEGLDDVVVGTGGEPSLDLGLLGLLRGAEG